MTTPMAEVEWEEFRASLRQTSIFCTRYAGFGCTVPEANQKLMHFLEHYPTESIYHISNSIDKFVEDINQQWEAGESVEISDTKEDDVQPAAHFTLPRIPFQLSVSLCYIGLALRELISAHSGTDSSMVRKCVESLLSLSTEYLHSTVKSISGCILSSQQIGRILAISDILGNMMLCEWFTEAEFEAYDMLEALNMGDNVLQTLTLQEFSSQPAEFWLTELEKTNNNETPIQINTEKFTSCWQLVTNMFKKATIS